MNIIAVLRSNLSEVEKKEIFNGYLNSQITPQPIKTMLIDADIVTKLAVVVQSDSVARQVVFDLLTKYGTLEYPER